MSYNPDDDAHSISSVLATAIVTFLVIASVRMLFLLITEVWANYQRYGSHPALRWSLIGWLATGGIGVILIITQQPMLINLALGLFGISTALWLMIVAVASAIFSQQETGGYSEALDDVLSPWRW